MNFLGTTSLLQKSEEYQYNETIDPITLLTSECFRKDPGGAWIWARQALKTLENLNPPSYMESILKFYKESRSQNMKTDFVTSSLDGILKISAQICGISDFNFCELRGNLFESKCEENKCDFKVETRNLDGKIPKCKKCNKNMRPDCVLLDELISTKKPDKLKEMKNIIENADCLILIGNCWQEEPELNESILFYVMKNKPVIEFSKTSLLRAGKIKFVCGDPDFTVPRFVDACKLLGETKSKSISRARGSVSQKSLLTTAKIHNWQLIFPSKMRQEKTEDKPIVQHEIKSLKAYKGKEFGRSANNLRCDTNSGVREKFGTGVVDMVKWKASSKSQKNMKIPKADANLIKFVSMKRMMGNASQNEKLRKEMLAVLLSKNYYSNV